MRPNRILIVEDEEIVAMDIEARLGLLGYSVTGVASSTVQALALARDTNPDLVLMDIRLRGDVDGIAGAQLIRERFHLPVIFLTAHADESTLERAKFAEPFGYILKPFEDRELHTVIEMALYKHQAEKEILHLNRLYSALSQVNQAIVRASEVNPLCEEVCRVVVKFGHFPLAWVGQYALSGGGLVLRGVATADGSLLQDFQAIEIGQLGWLPSVDAWGSTGPLIINQNQATPSDPGWTELAKHGLRESVVVAIRPHESTWGVLCFHAGEEGFFGAKERNLVEEIASDLAYAMENIGRENERRSVQEALRHREEVLRRITENMRDLLCLADLDERFVYLTPSYHPVLGYLPEDLLGRSVFEKVHPEDLAHSREVFRECVAERKPRCTELRFQNSSGQYVWVECIGNVAVGADGLVNSVVITSRDISERKQAESALRESENRFRTLIEQAGDGFELTDPEGRYLEVNSATCRQLGYSREELLGLRITDIDPEVSAEMFTTTFQTLVDRPAVTFVSTHRRKDGTTFPVEVTASVLRIGGALRGLSLARDITERKRAEETHHRLETQLIQAQKMEAVGQLAGGVAHDFNNILTTILMQLSLLQEDPELSNEARTSLKELEVEANRAANLTRQLLSFSRRQILEYKILDINSLLGNLLKMLRRLIGEHISLEFKGTASEIWVRADPGMLEQVVMNLVVNARDAMPKGGRIVLTSQLLELDDTANQRNPEAYAGRFACLSVSDNGVGMDETTLEHVFEPFFTTKEVGKGTGLGLATVFGIVKQHAGWIEVESALGQGSTFKICLPVTSPLPSASVGAAPVESVPRGCEAVLLVEDEASVRHVLTTLLRQQGYQVREASDGPEALREWKKFPRHPDLLITDSVMPGGMSGLELADQLRREKPNLKVVLMSGYSPEVMQNKTSGNPKIEFLRKPFEALVLTKLVRSCLDG